MRLYLQGLKLIDWHSKDEEFQGRVPQTWTRKFTCIGWMISSCYRWRVRTGARRICGRKEAFVIARSSHNLLNCGYYGSDAFPLFTLSMFKPTETLLLLFEEALGSAFAIGRRCGPATASIVSEIHTVVNGERVYASGTRAPGHVHHPCMCTTKIRTKLRKLTPFNF